MEIEKNGLVNSGRTTLCPDAQEPAAALSRLSRSVESSEVRPLMCRPSNNGREELATSVTVSQGAVEQATKSEA